jgi:nucleoside-diphosphate-sugar epimerase
MNSATELAILRFSSLYGPGYDDGLPQRLLRQGRDTGSIEIRPPLDDAFDLLHVSAAAQTVRRAVESEGPGLWNVGSGELTTIRRLAEVCAEHARSELSVSDSLADRPGRILNWVDDGRARRELGHVNELTLDAGVDEIARGLV